MYICKNCGKEFLEKYSKWSNGDFCCKECARSYSTKNKRQEINEKVSKTLKKFMKIIVCQMVLLVIIKQEKIFI